MTAGIFKIPRSFILNSGICAAFFGIGIAVYYLFPAQYVYLVTEDTPAEYATTTAYIAGCFLLTWAMIKISDARTIMSALLLLFMFFVGMEEISWGQRIIGIETSDFFMEHNHQRELNIHNLSSVRYTKMIFHNAMLLWLLLSWVSWKRLGPFGRLLGWLKVPKIPPLAAPYFILALIYAYLGVIPKSEELNELLFALGFCFVSLDILYTTGPKSAPARSQGMAALAVAVAVVVSAIFLSIRWPWPEALASRMNLFATKEYPLRGLDAQAEKVFEYLLAKPGLRNPDTLQNYAAFLRERGEEERAKIILKMSLEEKKKRIADGRESGVAYYRLANFYASLSRHAEEQGALIKAIELYTAEIAELERKIHSGELSGKEAGPLLRYAYEESADAYERTGNFKEAERHRTLLSELRASSDR